MNAGRSRESLIALFALGALLINYPLVHLFGGDRLVFGIPLLYLYLFVCWAAIIVIIAIIVERRTGSEKPAAGGADRG